MHSKKKSLFIALLLIITISMTSCDDIVIEKDAFHLPTDSSEDFLENEENEENKEDEDQLSYYLVYEKDKMVTLEKILRSLGEDSRDYSLFSEGKKERKNKNFPDQDNTSTNNDHAESDNDSAEGSNNESNRSKNPSNRPNNSNNNSNNRGQNDPEQNDIDYNSPNTGEEPYNSDDWELPQVSDE